MTARLLPAARTLFDSVGPNPWVVRLAFEAKGVLLLTAEQLEARGGFGLGKRPWCERYKLRIVDKTPENRHRSMHGKNPAGTTPFVELEDGTCLAESVAIVEYLDALYPDCGPNLSGGEDPLLKAQVAMWTQRVQLSITAPFQRQYQYGEGLPYFKQHVPWAEASAPGLPGLRKQTTDSLQWLEGVMQDRVRAGNDTGFLAGTEDYTIPDLQLYCTAKFMGNPKVNRAKLTESFDPASTAFGPWLTEWFGRMDEIVGGLDASAATATAMPGEE